MKCAMGLQPASTASAERCEAGVEASEVYGARMALGLDGISYAAWRQPGAGGAETIRRVLIRLSDGMVVPARFNESWLWVPPRGVGVMDATETSSGRPRCCVRCF